MLSIFQRAVLAWMPVLALPGATSSAAKAEVPPAKRIMLFNGNNLEGFDTFLETKGLNSDPGGVFQVDKSVIRISGSELGYLITRHEHQHYSLRAEFKWGEATYPPRQGKARESGILFHVVGPNRIWPRSIEFHIGEGGTGDLSLVDGASLTMAGGAKISGRFNRYWKGPWGDQTGFRDPGGEVEKAHGKWNMLELTASGGTVTFMVNGKPVNEGMAANPARGKILLQSKGAEIFFRNIELRPLRR